MKKSIAMMLYKRIFLILSLCVMASALWACPAPECPGKAACACDRETLCNKGLSCVEGTCRKDANPDGGNIDGGVDGGSADEPRCDAGTEGCRCTVHDACNDGLSCQRGVCQKCPAGKAGCACAASNKCDKGLSCEAGVCKGCFGDAGCACFNNGRCNKGTRCKASADGSNGTCEACDKAGQVGCECVNDSECGKGLMCLNQRCTAASGLAKLPKKPSCYAPCQGNIRERDGSTRVCHPSHRLMKGCLVNQTCREGSCVVTTTKELKRESYPFCGDDSQCPSWQKCVHGRCYSNCNESTPCASGWTCHQYVCRQRCDVSEPKCGAKESCQRVGSEDGLCMPMVFRRGGSGGAPALFNTGTAKESTSSQSKEIFVLSQRELSLTNIAPTMVFAVTNSGSFDATIDILRESDTTNSSSPLAWLSFDLCAKYDAERTKCDSFTGKPTKAQPYTVTVPAGKVVFIKLHGADAGPKDAGSYEGILRLKGAQMTDALKVVYRKSGSGRWKGRLYSFGNFDATELDKIKSDSVAVRTFKNALLRRWINVKRNEISFAKFQAILQSLEHRTWQQTRVQQACRKLFSAQASDDVACYPDDSPTGFSVLSNSQREAPVPSGVASLVFAMDVKETDKLWKGRIVTSQTLHYPGDPQIQLSFQKAPGSSNVTFLDGLSATADLGGRYAVDAQQSCHDSEFSKTMSPWLLLDFVAGTSARAGSLFRNRFDCRSLRTPKSVPTGASQEQRELIQQQNASLSAANPIPNGRTLRRRLTLIDGALFDNDVLFALVKEELTNPFTNATGSLGAAWVRYGYLLLRHSSSEIKDADVVGSVAKTCSGAGGCSTGETCQDGVCQPATNQLKQVSCSPEIVKAAYNRTIATTSDLQSWSGVDLNNLIAALANGQPSTNRSHTALHIARLETAGRVEYAYTRDNKKRYVHYYCQDTKQFNGGPFNNPTDCPADSEVFYFEHATSELDMRNHPCQTGSASVLCTSTFEQLRTTPDYRDVPYICADAQVQHCSANAKDMRSGKIFLKPSSTSSNFVSSLKPLREALARAFRYRIKFQSRSGKNLGFTPSLCSSVAPSQTPYCYDPKVIEQLEQRVNCLEAILSDQEIWKRTSAGAKTTIKDFLKHAFSFSNRRVGSALITDFGFEVLNAELKVMLGDEAFTKALTSRYDLAGTRLIAFAGDELEPNGIKLSGIAGNEMYNLYLSTQYYQSVLDRFYSQASLIVKSMSSQEKSFLNADSATSYFQKLLLAATRKARGWGQIAANYHSFNRPDLAKHVLERAYVSTYVEQLVMTQLLHKLLETLDPKQIPQMRKEIERSILIYNAALLSMQERYQKVQQGLDLFGFPEGYLPFPALSRSAVASNPLDAIRTVLSSAKEKLRIAADKEQLALQQQRSFDTDAARFQSELVQIQRSYSEQLIGICGSLKDGDQSVPAIPRNAHLFRDGAIADPCGVVPGSSLYNAFLQLQQIGVATAQLKQQQQHVLQRIQNEKDRIQKFCDDKFSLAQISWNFQNDRRDMQMRINEINLLSQSVMRAGFGAVQIFMDRECQIMFGGAFEVKSKCYGSAITTAARLALLAAQEEEVITATIEQNKAKAEILAQQRDFARSQAQSVCNVCPPDQPNCTTQGVARIQSHNQLQLLSIELSTFYLHLLSYDYSLRQAVAQVRSLRHQAQRLIQQQDDAIALQLETSAAANDPNKRIYKNDAVIAAERTFNEALREAYRLTLVYEYYTSKTYERKGELYLIRMVSAGDINLESYMSRLEQAYRDFEEVTGRPQLRVLVLSLRDDILKIPRTGADGTPLGLQERVKAFQAQLDDPDNVDPNGYLRFNFPIQITNKNSVVSPVTFSHKVVYVEAEIKATSRGDEVGRIYLQQSGTGMIREANDNIKYYTLPRRTAVLNTFFNGHKTFEHAIYQNFRFQDRPLGNTQWSLMFNQVSETVNKDIDRNSMNDVLLYIYYQDFSK